MKTQLLSITLALLLSLFFLSQANATNLANPSNNASVELNLNNITATTSFEEDLSIENWMVDEELWSTSNELNFTEEMEISEEQLAIEPWMSNDEVFRLNTPKDTKTDNVLSIEDWMTEDSYWRL